jgi:two-component system cell cycle response regulator
VLKILIVDDDLTITELMKALMIMEGYEPSVVNDSTKALDIAASFQPDLITIDLMMPGISGFDLCEQLRQDPRFATLPILIVSAKDDPGTKDRAMRTGANDYITKPFNIDELLQRIRALTGS